MKEDNYKEELKAMTDLFVKELALIGCKNFVQSEDRLSFTYNNKSGFVYPYTETFVFNLKKGEGLGELKELIELSKPRANIFVPELTKKMYGKTLKYYTKLTEMGFKVKRESYSTLSIVFKKHKVLIYTNKDWFSGKSVVDGRGFHNLLRQLKNY
jgi:hypothetical protein